MIADILVIIFLTIKKIDINKINLKNIRPPIGHFYFTSLSIKSQQENYDKNRQINTLVTIPTKSAIKDAHKTNLVFFIPTLLV